MKPDEALTNPVEPGFHAVRCLLCQRVRPAELAGLLDEEWGEWPGLLDRYRIGLPEVFVSDTYCDGCAVFYRQLMTYGHPGRGLGWERSYIQPPLGSVASGQ